MTDEKRLWHYRWFRDLLWLVGGLIVLLLIWQVWAVLIPVLFGLALAYVVNPPVLGLQRRLGLPRWFSALVAAGFLLLVLTGLALYVVPKFTSQTLALAKNAPAYLHRVEPTVHEFLRRWSFREAGGANGNASTEPTTEASAGASTTMPAPPAPLLQVINPPAKPGTDPGNVGAQVLQAVGASLGVVGSLIDTTVYLVIVVIVTLICFFNFTWRWESILAWFDQFIPDQHRKRALDILGKMDRSVSAWFRGRLIQCAVLAVLLSVGWGLAGVPYWLLLGLVVGSLNMVPYLASVGWPVAVGLVWLDRVGKGQPFDPWIVLLWPSVVYLVAQNFDGWVVEPLVQGKATNLSPVSVLLAVLIGGSLAGILGMLLAVPLTACGKIIFQELVLPQWRAQRAP